MIFKKINLCCCDKVEGQPDRPTGLLASKVTEDSVELRWNSPSSGPSSLLSHELTCEDLSSDEPSIIHKTIMGVRTPEYTVEGLGSGVWYRFSLVAISSSLERSLPSEPIEVLTKEKG